VRLDNQQAPRDVREELEKCLGPIEMIEKPAAENGIEWAIARHIPGVIANVFEVVQIGVRLDGRLEAQTSELDGVTALETAEVCDPDLARVTRKNHTQQTCSGSKPWMFFNREADFRTRIVPVVQANVVSCECHLHSGS
jgi:hypothetical protein